MTVLTTSIHEGSDVRGIGAGGVKISALLSIGMPSGCSVAINMAMAAGFASRNALPTAGNGSVGTAQWFGFSRWNDYILEDSAC
jgi:hypothetical protein